MRPFAIRFGVLEMGTRAQLHFDHEDDIWKCATPSNLLENIMLHKIGRPGFASIHFASTINTAADNFHFFPRKELREHSKMESRFDDIGQERKCQKFPIFGRSDLTNVHCTLHDLAAYKQRLSREQRRSYVNIECTTQMCQIYSNGSHMFPSRTNAHGTRISEDKRVIGFSCQTILQRRRRWK